MHVAPRILSITFNHIQPLSPTSVLIWTIFVYFLKRFLHIFYTFCDFFMEHIFGTLFVGPFLHFLHLFLTFFGHFWNTFWDHFRHILKLFGKVNCQMSNIRCQMSKYQNVKISKCQNVKMSKCQNVNMSTCQLPIVKCFRDLN